MTLYDIIAECMRQIQTIDLDAEQQCRWDIRIGDGNPKVEHVLIYTNPDRWDITTYQSDGLRWMQSDLNPLWWIGNARNTEWRMEMIHPYQPRII